VFVDQLGGIVTWQAVSWDFRPKEQDKRIPAPQSTPKYKFILVHQEASEHPERSADESAASICKRIDDALANGYTVLISPLWEWNERQFVDSFSTITGKDKPQAIYRALKSKYDGKPVFENETTGRYYALTTKRGA